MGIKIVFRLYKNIYTFEYQKFISIYQYNNYNMIIVIYSSKRINFI